MAQRKQRIHDWHKLKWPFCVTFIYYAVISLFTGTAEASEAGFLAVLALALLIDLFAYGCYCFFLSRDTEDMNKLWFVFILAYTLTTIDQLEILWQMLSARAAA